jgi:hypothetical protein
MKMMDNNLAVEAQETQDALEFLFKQVENLEQHTGITPSDNKEGPATRAIHSIINSTVSIGDPNNNLTHLTPEKIAELGLPLNLSKIHQRQMKNKEYDFYYMTVMVDTMPLGGARFTELYFHIKLNPLEQYSAPIVQLFLPPTKWHKVAGYGAGAQVDTDNEFEVIVRGDTASIPFGQSLPADGKVQIGIKSKASGEFTIPKFQFDIGRFDIAGSGPGQNHAQWLMSNTDLSEKVQHKFMIVFKVPPKQSELALEMYANAQVDFDWLSAQLRHVTKKLHEDLYCWLNPKKSECEARAEFFRLGTDLGYSPRN